MPRARMVRATMLMIRMSPKQDETRGPSLAMPILIGRDRIGIYHHGQRSGGLRPTVVPEAIAKGGKEQRSSFTSDASKSEEDGGENAAVGRGNNDGANGFGFAGTECHGAFAQIVWNVLEKFLGAAQCDGNHHQAESERTSEGREVFEGQDDHGVGKNADDDGRDAIEKVGGIANDGGNEATAEFSEVDTAEEADGHAKERGCEQKLAAAHDGVGHAAAGFANGFGKLRKESPVDGSAAVVNEIAKNEKKHANGDERAETGHGHHEVADKFSPANAGATHRVTPLPF